MFALCFHHEHEDTCVKFLMKCYRIDPVCVCVCERETDRWRERQRMRDSGSELLHPGKIEILDSR